MLAAWPAGIGGLCFEESGVLEGPGQAGQRPMAGGMGVVWLWARALGALAWHIALNKTESLVVSKRTRGCPVSCGGSRVTVYMTCLCGYIALYLKERSFFYEVIKLYV